LASKSFNTQLPFLKMAPPRQKPAKKVTKSHKANQSRSVTKEQSLSDSNSIELQQLLLNVFRDSFSERLESDIHPLLQEVKGYLYNRDFLTAFGRNDYLETYAARWSPSRALGYLQVFTDLIEHISPALSHRPDEDRLKKIVCIGGGAGAEIVALAGLLKCRAQTEPEAEHPMKLSICAIDIADWSSVVSNLHQNIITAPKLSKHASAAAQAASTQLVSPEAFDVSFHQHDILNTDASVLRPLLQDVTIVTIMFTLNELYSTSLSLTQLFLLNLTACLREGALLLVVDSPGSYSSVSLNGAEKKYPMQWLLDHTLLKEGPKGEAAAWSKVEEDESRWFRLDGRLKYSIELENMRFQLHLYRKLG
jgi:25S rRNA (uracil2843-N3)-methyltransferase